MKRITMMVLGLLVASSLLSGCYSTACAHDQDKPVANYKDESPSK